VDEVFNDTLGGVQRLELALLVCDYEDRLLALPLPADDADGDAERERRMVAGLTPLAAYCHECGIGPTDFRRLDNRENVMLPAVTAAYIVSAPDVFHDPDRPGTRVGNGVLRGLGLIQPWET
jgi:hypothetical protein